MIPVDQILSLMPGFITQIKGILIIKRYKYMTVFMCQYFRFTYTHFQKTAMEDETKGVKISFEKMCTQYGF